MDFFKVNVKMTGRKAIIYPEYITGNFKDVMIKGQDFYAVWDEANNTWSQSKWRVSELIDEALEKKEKDIREVMALDGNDIYVKYLKWASTKAIDEFNHWVKDQATDNFVWLNSRVTFKNTVTTRDDYSSIRLDYDLAEGSTEAWDTLTNRLYSPEEKRKIEFAIGSIVSGDSKFLQKLFIFVGDAGTGKSTIMKIIREMFPGYCATIDVEALGNNSASFALEPLRDNPLIAIQDDTDLSHIDTNVRLNSIVSHEPMLVNEKHKKIYRTAFNTIIFAGSNREVNITDARSGLLRRVIDIEPTGQVFSRKEYDDLMERIKFEHGAIAYKCMKVYKSDPKFYNKYYPIKMIRATNRLYNFVEDSWNEFLDENNGTSLREAWNCYLKYCDFSDMKYHMDRLKFKIELKDYFENYIPDYHDNNGKHLRNYYSKFKFNKIGIINNIDEEPLKTWLKFNVSEKTYFDNEMYNCQAQYANEDGTPKYRWKNCTTFLENINPTKLHYVKVPVRHIIIDFDIKDPSTGNKSFELNVKEANKWPPTYAELSKSGEGIHLHYNYDGDVEELSNLYSDDIEIKVFTGNASLRRKLTQCVNLPIATINSGLPKKKGDKKMVDDFVVKNEKAIRTMVEKNLRKEYHPGTKPSIDYIYKILEDAYEAGVEYDITDMRNRVLAFANSSTHQSEYCVKLVNKMKFMSDIDERTKFERNAELSRKYGEEYEKAPLMFYDVEVFPNLFVLVYKFEGKDCVQMINPTAEDIQPLLKYRLVGFNCRRYDNHILYARLQGYNNEQLYNLSQKIVTDSKNCMFSNAYNLSYTDVYDFCSSGNKQSLKKWEIELGIHHLELGYPWDQPVPQDRWEKVAEYCCNDVISTEIVFNHLKSDWIARQILADLSGLSVNDTTNQHTTKIIFGFDKHPQSSFMYRDMSQPVTWLPDEVKDFLWERFPKMMKWWSENTDSLLPYFPGYSFEKGKSVYKGVEVGEGGYVEAEPGMYGYTALLDVASMHPHSVLAECLFGEHTQNFADLVDGRILIKHEDWDRVNDILDGKLAPYVEKVKSGEITSKDLADALKTAINSVYGLTSAKFENPFRDIRNKDNIVAKRGALFMVDLAEAVKAKGWKVAHIKTDSIKIPDATKEVVNFVTEFGERYGYSFEWEATYDKICLINDAVYIARYREKDGSVGKWTATGARFDEPYIFKTLFTHEPVEFDDYCQTKSCATSLYLDMNENLEESYSKLNEKLNKILKSYTVCGTTVNWEDYDKDPEVIEINKKIANHKMIFVGKVGSFLPVTQHGGDLLREKDGKYYSVSGSKGYKWLEAEVVKNNQMEDLIDESYYIRMADDAVAKIEEFGSFEWFVDPAPYNSTVPYDTLPTDDFTNFPEDEVPWDISNEKKGETK